MLLRWEKSSRQSRVERLGGFPRDDVVRRDGAALFDDLARGEEPGDSVEAWAVLIGLRRGYVGLERVLRVLLGRCLRLCIRLDGAHVCSAP